MTAERPNLIFISVDALRQDRMSVYGYERPTTPNLERLAERSVVCRNHFAVNASTIGTFPTILNSSRPLSYGGFDKGGIGRPPSIFAQLHRGGYQTYMMSTVHWVNRFFGYDDGVDVEELLFSLSSQIGITGALTRTSLARHMAGDISDDELLSLVGPVVESSFDRLEAFARERIRRHDIDKHDFRYAPFYADRYNYRRVIKTIATHRKRYREDPRGYLATYMPAPFGATGWLSNIWRTYRRPERLLEEVFAAIRASVLGVRDPSAAFLSRQRYKRYADADSLVSHILKTAQTRDDTRPFFMWTHFFDTHLPYCPGAHPNWYKNASHHLEACGYDPTVDPAISFGKAPVDEDGWRLWGALYDAAVHYVDTAIGRLVDGLETAGLLDNTVIVLCGDHGEELGENNDTSHHFRLYGYTTHVPLIVSGRHLEPRDIEDFTTHMDIAPTLTALGECAPAADWVGRPIFDGVIPERDHVLMETFFGSPCDFENRPLYFAVRDRGFHFMWKEYRDPTDKLSPHGNQLFDIQADPRQTDNIFDAGHPSVVQGERYIAARMSELPEIDPERIKRLFPWFERS